MFKNLFAWVVAIQVLLGSGLAYADSLKETAPFNEFEWRVEQIGQHKKLIQHYQADQRYTYFSFNPYTHRVTGSGLCNKFLAHFTNEKDQVTISDITKNNTMCLSPEVNAQDQLFFQSLKSVQYFEMRGKVLKLMDGQKQVVLVARKTK